MQFDLRTHAFRAARGSLLVLLALIVFGPRATFAEVTFAGNGTVGGLTFAVVQTAATFEAGGSTADVVVGIDSPLAGGVFIDGTAPSPATLVSTTVVLGQNAGSVGAADLTDLAALWDIDTLTVGSAGQGLIVISNSAAINADTAIIGDLVNGSGFVGVNGLGSRFVAIDLTVGEGGHGSIDVEDRALLFTTGVVMIGSTIDTGDGNVFLTGLGTRWAAEGAVTIGGLVGFSHGTLQIADRATAQVEGALTINPRGDVELAGGTLRMLPQASNLITNNGLILGDGFVDGGINIGATGEVRNGADLANQREHLLVAEVVVNGGTIESQGGEMEFEAAVVNDLNLIARDAIMRFDGGLTNNGDTVLGGDTTLHGTVTSASSVHVLADSEALVLGNLTFTGGASSLLSLTIGEAAGTLDVIGQITLGDVTLDLDYAAGVLSQEGDSYQVLSSTQTILGDFSNAVGTSGNRQAIADGRLWDITGLGTDTIFVTATGTTISSFSADFDTDGDVDGKDFLTWQRGVGLGTTFAEGDATLNTIIDSTDLAIWESQWGTGVGPITALTAVPEPSAALLALLALALTLAASRRSGC